MTKLLSASNRRISRLVAVLGVALALAALVGVNPTQASAATAHTSSTSVVCAKGWTAHTLSKSYVTGVGSANITYKVSLPYCSASAALTEAKVFPGGVVVAQTVSATDKVPLTKITVSDLHRNPVKVTQTFCKVANSSTYTPCFSVVASSTFTTTFAVKNPLTGSWHATSTKHTAQAQMFVTATHGAWVNSMKLS